MAWRSRSGQSGSCSVAAERFIERRAAGSCRRRARARSKTRLSSRLTRPAFSATGSKPEGPTIVPSGSTSRSSASSNAIVREARRTTGCSASVMRPWFNPAKMSSAVRSARNLASDTLSKGSNAAKRRAGLPCEIDRVLCVLEQDLCRTSVTRRDHSADAQTGVYRSGIGFKWCGRNGFNEAPRRDLHLFGVAAGEDEPKLVAGITGNYVAAAHFAPQARHHLYDLVGSVIAVGAIEREEVLDGRKQHHEGFGATAS